MGKVWVVVNALIREGGFFVVCVCFRLLVWIRQCLVLDDCLVSTRDVRWLFGLEWLYFHAGFVSRDQDMSRLCMIICATIIIWCYSRPVAPGV